MVQVAVREAVVLDPTGDVYERVLGLSSRLDSVRGKVAGLLDNSMPNTGVLMDALGEVLLEEYGVARVIRRSKPNMSTPCPSDMFEELVKDADFLVAGAGV